MPLTCGHVGDERFSVGGISRSRWKRFCIKDRRLETPPTANLLQAFSKCPEPKELVSRSASTVTHRGYRCASLPVLGDRGVPGSTSSESGAGRVDAAVDVCHRICGTGYLVQIAGENRSFQVPIKKASQRDASLGSCFTEWKRAGGSLMSGATTNKSSQKPDSAPWRG